MVNLLVFKMLNGPLFINFTVNGDIPISFRGDSVCFFPFLAQIFSDISKQAKALKCIVAAGRFRNKVQEKRY